MSIPGRLEADTFDLVLGGDYPVRLSVARDKAGVPVEVVLKPSGAAGKSGGSLDLIFFDLGIALSRALQGRDPETGKVLPGLIEAVRAGGGR